MNRLEQCELGYQTYTLLHHGLNSCGTDKETVLTIDEFKQKRKETQLDRMKAVFNIERNKIKVDVPEEINATIRKYQVDTVELKRCYSSEYMYKLKYYDIGTKSDIEQASTTSLKCCDVYTSIYPGQSRESVAHTLLLDYQSSTDRFKLIDFDGVDPIHLILAWTMCTARIKDRVYLEINYDILQHTRVDDVVICICVGLQGINDGIFVKQGDVMRECANIMSVIMMAFVNPDLIHTLA